MQRPAWPYILGSVGGVIFAIGACAFLYATFAERAPDTAFEIVTFGSSIGALLVGIGWVGLFKQRQAGIGPILGSFVVTLAILYARYGDTDNFDLVGMLVVVSLVLFGLGHAVTRGIGGARILGAIAALIGTFQIIVVSAHWNIGIDGVKLVLVAIVGSLGLLGLVLALALPALRRAPIDDTTL